MIATQAAGFPDGAPGDPAQSSSQIGLLFYGGLGAVAGASITTTHNSSYALFSNLQNTSYWFGTEYSANPQAVWVFASNNGIQGGNVSKTNQYYVLVVAPGEVNPVTSPTALLVALLTELTGVVPEGLADKVERAQDHVQATCSALAQFVNQVQHQNGKTIDPQLDAKLVADAKAIEAALGCSLLPTRNEKRRSPGYPPITAGPQMTRDMESGGHCAQHPH